MKNCSTQIVNAAVEIYNRLSLDLLPTPAKSHYVFNLRDLSKCVQGERRTGSHTQLQYLNSNVEERASVHLVLLLIRHWIVVSRSLFFKGEQLSVVNDKQNKTMQCVYLLLKCWVLASC